MYELEELEEEEVEAMQKEMDRHCLQLCIALLNHQLDHDEYESAAISYFAVAGLEHVHGDGAGQYRFKDLAQCMPVLSGFIKIAQMLTVQYCLEQEKNVIYQDIELNMTDFRRLVHKLLEEARAILMNELLFIKEKGERELPTYCWSELKDNPSKDKPDWYFIQDRRNRMQEQDHWLLNRILQTPELASKFMHQETGVWKQRRVNDYLDKLSYFLEKLLVLIYMTGRQPARSTELLSIRYCNTKKGGHRNIFIENGLLVIVTYYYKGYNITGTEKIIHRYLSKEVGELLVFGDEEIPSAFLWSADRRKKWTGDRFREVLKRESDRLIGVPLNKKSYRHIAIAISDRYMKRTKFDSDEDKNKKLDKDIDEQHDESIAKQSGHTMETAGAVYARLLDEAPSHVQQMRYRFRVSSIEWHEVLQFSGQLIAIEPGRESRLRLGGDLKRGWEEKHERSPGPRIRRWQALRQTNLQETLQRLMGPETRFRGKQHVALQAIVANKSPIILMIRTGGGKSLMFMLPASVQEAGTTVVVTPLIALKQDMQR
ncbi:hypothetical protein GP486_006567 [Trichoglossum hirsutum]|uniref:DEAD/DEAH-box helicase domain-containing protein n=1 Tax=Trichoglossum hirsutum TaxID=265104 RepID=A0A9P8IDB5_9PEZI|nr:hypothetical protein GP486_006567 [Trichoglossum hirsutum]